MTMQRLHGELDFGSFYTTKDHLKRYPIACSRYDNDLSPKTTRIRRRTLLLKWSPSPLSVFAMGMLLLLLILSSFQSSDATRVPSSTSISTVSPRNNTDGKENAPATAATASSRSNTETSSTTSPRKAHNNKKHDKETKPKKTTKRQSKKLSPSTLRSRETADSLRRIQREWKDAVQQGIAFDWAKGRPVKFVQSQHLYLGPINRNVWIWHFSIQGLAGSAFEQGLYHGRILLPPNYPAKPPHVQMWTPSGRFVCKFDICLTASNYHPETWNSAAWSVRTIVEALRLHMIAASNEIGGITESYQERVERAMQSRKWKCRIGSILVDHENMIQQGLFVDAKPATQDDVLPQDDERLEQGLRQRNAASLKLRQHEPEQPLTVIYSTVLAIGRVLRSPVKLALIAFVVLFCFLNR